MIWLPKLNKFNNRKIFIVAWITYIYVSLIIGKSALFIVSFEILLILRHYKWKKNHILKILPPTMAYNNNKHFRRKCFGRHIYHELCCYLIVIVWWYQIASIQIWSLILSCKSILEAEIDNYCYWFWCFSPYTY